MKSWVTQLHKGSINHCVEGVIWGKNTEVAILHGGTLVACSRLKGGTVRASVIGLPDHSWGVCFQFVADKLYPLQSFVLLDIEGVVVGVVWVVLMVTFRSSAQGLWSWGSQELWNVGSEGGFSCP
jgi:hypothetical protein